MLQVVHREENWSNLATARLGLGRSDEEDGNHLEGLGEEGHDVEGEKLGDQDLPTLVTIGQTLANLLVHEGGKNVLGNYEVLSDLLR